ncbi:MAG: hypothetical protein KAV40_01090 [Thermoplasmatales archaeon]|nr:hypothetical protein [Thermoplasmatales archaeon]
MIELHEIPEYEGKQVIVEGIVTEYRITTYGGQIIEIKNLDSENISKTIVFVEGETSVEYGDRIQATGTVQKYKDEWEIVVNNERFVKILQKWADITFPLWQLAENPDKYVGTNVNVTGFIDRKYDAYFYLVDSEEQYTVAVYYDSSKFYNFSQGNAVYVGARFVYDAETMRYVLQAKDEAHGISVVEEE